MEREYSLEIQAYPELNDLNGRLGSALEQFSEDYKTPLSRWTEKSEGGWLALLSEIEEVLVEWWNDPELWGDENVDPEAGQSLVDAVHATKVLGEIQMMPPRIECFTSRFGDDVGRICKGCVHYEVCSQASSAALSVLNRWDWYRGKWKEEVNRERG